MAQGPLQHPPDQETELLTAMSLSVECSHRYGTGPLVLDSIDLSFRSGVTGLVGINGAGKSTLLGVIAGVLRPHSGSAEVRGFGLYGPDRRRALAEVGFMPQSFEPPAGATVLEVVSYLGWLRGLSASQARNAAEDAMEMVGLAERRKARVRELSGGMRRRLAFAQAIVTDPPVLLLDEPTTGLDPEQRAALREIVGRPGGRSVTVVSSHLMEDISSLASDLVVLEQGRVIFDAPMAVFADLPGASDEERLLHLLARIRSSRG